MDKVLLNLAISFCLRQLAQFGTSTNWATVKVDYDARVAALVPGTWLDAEAVSLTNETIDAFAFVCKDSADMAKLVNAAVAADWAGAWVILKDLVAKGYNPTTPDQVKLKAAILAA